jgi:hypothetical protein
VGTYLKFSIAALSLAVGVTACRDASANSENEQADLKRDLEMAASATVNLATPKVDPALLTLESQPKSAPQVSSVLKKAAGNRVVHSHAPTVRAEPEVAVAAVDESESVVAMEQTVAPDNGEPVAVAPRPAPAGDYGTGGGIFGTGTGSVIRGTGGIDGDNCDLHRRGRGGRGPIYRIPNSGGSVIPSTPGISIGMGTIGGGMGARRTSPSRPSSGMQSVGRPSIGRTSPVGRRSR